MQIILVGINHKTAPVAVRERLALNSHLTTDALRALKAEHPSGEFVILSTCNRVECYAALTEQEVPDAQVLAVFLSRFRGVDYDSVRDYFYVKLNNDAVRHLLTVTSSLDSMVIGESQIIAQVKESYKLACQCGSTGKILNHLFHIAFHTTKEIFSNTSIASRRVSVAGVATEHARRLFDDIRNAGIVVIGAGQMGQLLVEHFRHLKCSQITIFNRSCDRACRLAEKHGVGYEQWDQLEEKIVSADIVVGSAAAHEGYLFTREMFKRIVSRRRNKILLVIDIAVPRTFEPAINDIDSVYLYSIDDLGKVVKDNIKLRQEELEQAIEIICTHLTEFADWFRTQTLGPLIGQLESVFGQIMDETLNRFFVGAGPQADCRRQMETSVRTIVNKFLHCVVKSINAVAMENGPSDAEQFAIAILERATEIISEERENAKDRP